LIDESFYKVRKNILSSADFAKGTSIKAMILSITGHIEALK
jgi:hypothetical protein